MYRTKFHNFRICESYKYFSFLTYDLWQKTKFNFVKNSISLLTAFAQFLGNFLNFGNYSLRYFKVPCKIQDLSKTGIKFEEQSIIEKVIVFSEGK